MRRRVGLVGCAVAVTSALVVWACTGSDPVDDDPGGVGPNSDGGTSTDGGGGGADASGPPALVLSAEPLTIRTGASDSLRLKVVMRSNVGDVTFRVKGLPEGLTAPTTTVLAATADALSIPLDAASAARHGDFALTVEADGAPYKFPAKVVLRGGPGVPDTGFGNAGKDMVAVDSAADRRIIALADDRLILGFSPTASTSKLYPIDLVGKLGASIAVTTPGTLEGLAARADGGFAVLLRTAGGLSLVNYTKDFVAGVAITVSSVNAAAVIAATPAGTLVAQVQPSGGGPVIAVQRFGATAVDATFPATTLPAPSPSLNTLNGNADGSAWLSYQRDVSQVTLAKVAGGAATKFSDLVATHNCGKAGAFGGDMLCYYTSDGNPMYSLRRFDASGDAGASFGTNGILALTNPGSVDGVHSTAPDKIYFVTTTAATKTVHVRALDAAGALRTVFATGGTLDATGENEVPRVAYDARGRIVLLSTEVNGGTLATDTVVRRFWD